MDPKVTQGPSTAKAVIHLLHPLMLQLHMPQLAQRKSPVTHLGQVVLSILLEV